MEAHLLQLTPYQETTATRSVDSQPTLKRYAKVINATLQQQSLAMDNDNVFHKALIEHFAYKDEGASIFDYMSKSDKDHLNDLAFQLHRELIVNSNKAVADEQKAFQQHIAAGAMTGLQDNRFYQLASELFGATTRAAEQHFLATQKNLLLDAPKAENAPELWQSIMVVLTFIISAITTAYGVNDLLQNETIAATLSLGGNSGAAARLTASFFVGITLSYIILYFKSALFRSIMNTGHVLSGIRRAYTSQPLWMVLASILTLVSLKTNYDGGVAFVSKSSSLNDQSIFISQRVQQAFGQEFTTTTTPTATPSSFYQTIAILKQRSNILFQQLQQIPEDEAKGKASSGIAQQGPRYWGKYLLIYGNSEKTPQSMNKILGHGKLALEVDGIVRTADIDLTTSVRAKLDKIINDYHVFVTAIDAQTQTDLRSLNTMMHLQQYTPQEVIRIFYLEHYHINAIVAKIVIRLERIETEYQSTINAINALVAKTSRALTQIDRAGHVKHPGYVVKARFPQSNIAGIKALKAGIPQATHKSFDELVVFLNTQYGAFLATLLMVFILALSIFIDLADLALFSAANAKRGNREQSILADRISAEKAWMDSFVNLAQEFFARSDIQAVFAQLAPAESRIYRDTLYRLLEEINPKTRDPLDRNWKNQLFIAIAEPFSRPHSTGIAFHNQLATAIDALAKHKNVHINRYFELLLPGLNHLLQDQHSTVATIFAGVATEQQARRLSFYSEIRQAGADNDQTLINQMIELKHQDQKMQRSLLSMEKKIKKLTDAVINAKSNYKNSWFPINRKEIIKQSLEEKHFEMKKHMRLQHARLVLIRAKVEKIFKKEVGHHGDLTFLMMMRSFFSWKVKHVNFELTRRKWLSTIAKNETNLSFIKQLANKPSSPPKKQAIRKFAEHQQERHNQRVLNNIVQLKQKTVAKTIHSIESKLAVIK